MPICQPRLFASDRAKCNGGYCSKCQTSTVSRVKPGDYPFYSKKSAHAEEQLRSDVLMQRQDWFAGQLDLDPRKLVFIDETGASTNLARKGGVDGCASEFRTAVTRRSRSAPACAFLAWWRRRRSTSR